MLTGSLSFFGARFFSLSLSLSRDFSASHVFKLFKKENVRGFGALGGLLSFQLDRLEKTKKTKNKSKIEKTRELCKTRKHGKLDKRKKFQENSSLPKPLEPARRASLGRSKWPLGLARPGRENRANSKNQENSSRDSHWRPGSVRVCCEHGCVQVHPR